MDRSETDGAARVPVLGLDVDGVLVHPALELGAQNWDAYIERDLGVPPDLLGQLFFRQRWSKVVIGAAELEAELEAALAEMGSDRRASEVIEYWFRMDGRRDDEMVLLVDEWRRATGGQRRA